MSGYKTGNRASRKKAAQESGGWWRNRNLWLRICSDVSYVSFLLFRTRERGEDRIVAGEQFSLRSGEPSIGLAFGGDNTESLTHFPNFIRMRSVARIFEERTKGKQQKLYGRENYVECRLEAGLVTMLCCFREKEDSRGHWQNKRTPTVWENVECFDEENN